MRLTEPADAAEHYCTMFDANFLPMGVALAESLRRQSPNSQLWVLCLDDATEAALRRLRLPHVRTIALPELETDALRQVKAGRTLREYYWTLTPWTFEAVFARAPEAERVTYLDADLYFFQSPAVLLDMMGPGHQALIKPASSRSRTKTTLRPGVSRSSILCNRRS